MQPAFWIGWGYKRWKWRTTNCESLSETSTPLKWKPCAYLKPRHEPFFHVRTTKSTSESFTWRWVMEATEQHVCHRQHPFKSWSHRWVSTLTSMSLLISFTCFGIPRPASTESTTSSLGAATAQVLCHPSIPVLRFVLPRTPGETAGCWDESFTYQRPTDRRPMIVNQKNILNRRFPVQRWSSVWHMSTNFCPFRVASS